MMTLFSMISSKVWVYALLGLFVIGFLYRVYKAGQDKEKLDRLENEFNAVVTRNKIDDEVESMSDSRVISELRKHGWLRESSE